MAAARDSISFRELIARRVSGVLLAGSSAASASDVVDRLGAVQAQDYLGAKWALAQRAPGLTDADVEREFERGDILRTHVLRPTWHFVRPADIRWMLELTAPRVRRTLASQSRAWRWDAKLISRSMSAIAKALEDGKSLTRTELGDALARARVKVAHAQHLGHLVMHAELDAIVCSGPRRGSEMTYMLLDTRVPSAPALSRDDALLRLARRYFATRGPATLKDFAWWSGLTVADAKRGVEMMGSELTHATFDGDPFWFVDGPVGRARSSAWLLPNYDEYFIAYKDRGAVARRIGHAGSVIGGDARVTHVIFVNGELVGRWTRTSRSGKVVIALETEVPLTGSERTRINSATRAFCKFLGGSVTIANTPVV